MKVQRYFTDDMSWYKSHGYERLAYDSVADVTAMFYDRDGLRWTRGEDLTIPGCHDRAEPPAILGIPATPPPFHPCIVHVPLRELGVDWACRRTVRSRSRALRSRDLGAWGLAATQWCKAAALGAKRMPGLSATGGAGG
ncbi:hypothetical protein GCM10017776_59730 [Streptomyces griseoluteus]|nr:hypothetical protein GCM10017776_59730 [Streptomyces griseoluteus]